MCVFTRNVKRPYLLCMDVTSGNQREEMTLTKTNAGTQISRSNKTLKNEFIDRIQSISEMAQPVISKKNNYIYI